VDIRAWVAPKTRNQRAYLHSIIRQCADVMGCDERLLKEDLKQQLGVVMVEPSLVTGDRVARVLPTELYSREQESAFIEAITAWAAGKGIHVRAPHEAA
jgi:hypothetical protein